MVDVLRRALSGAVTFGLVLAALAPVASGSAQASAGRASAGRAGPTDAPLLRSTDPGAARFRPVGHLKTGSSCTATLVSKRTPKPAAKGLIVTAGHCVGFLGSNEVRIDQPAPSSWKFTPAYFVDTVAQHKSFQVTKVRYASMKGIDLAVLQLGATYDELAAIGVRPLALSTSAPPAGRAIEAAHIPVNGVPNAERYLRRSVCRTKARVNLAEHSWIWRGTSPNDCAGIAGGSSGGLVVASGRRTVVSVLNTTVESSLSGVCELGRPCETGSGGVTMRPGTTYAIGVNGLAGCLRPGPVFDPGRCRLDPGRGAIPQENRKATQSTVNGEPARWAAALTANGLPYARVKTGPLGRTDCRRTKGYGRVFAISDRPTITDQLPKTEDFYVLCVQSGPSATVDSSWVPARHATFDKLRVDDTPPTVKPVISVRDGGKRWRVEPIFQKWEIIDYDVKWGPIADVNCADPAGYKPYNRIPEFLDKAQSWRFCAIGSDSASNHTPPLTRDIPATP